MRVEVLSSPAEIAALAPSWDDLLARSAVDRAFGSARWFLSWHEVAGWEPRVLVARSEATLAGVLALVSEDGGPLRFPGELADYHDAVVATGDLETTAALLAAARDSARDAGLGLRLSCLAPGSHLTLAAPAASLQGPDLRCPYLDLSAGYAAFFATRSSNFRSALRRAWKRAGAAGLTAEELRPGSFPSTSLAPLFLALHGARFARSCFDRPLDRAFASRALPALFAEGRLRAFALRRGEEVLALSLCMVGASSLGHWNGGWRPQAAPFSPGKLLLDLEARTCCQEGIGELDLLRGEEPYKAQWATGERTLQALVEPAP